MSPARTVAIAVAATLSLSACSSGGGKRSDVPAPVTLNWSPITRAEDGSLLTDLKGYRLEYGRAESGRFAARVSLPAGARRYVLRVGAGSWRARLVAVSASRGESAPSNVVTFRR